MKKNQIKTILVFVLIIFNLFSCSSDDDEVVRVIPTMNVEVVENEDSSVTINSQMLTGETVSAKIIDYYPIADITFDYNVEVRLVKFVEENGVSTALPYTKNINKGLKAGNNYITAIIAYNAEGRAVCSAFQVWKAAGTEGLWSKDNSAGELDENVWD